MAEYKYRLVTQGGYKAGGAYGSKVRHIPKIEFYAITKDGIRIDTALSVRRAKRKIETYKLKDKLRAT